ncbi:MAG TPA: hypothetical protein VGJ91_13150 [Polyangiaceae bacterium]
MAGLSPLLCAPPAAAEPFETGGVGVFAGYAFGERGGFEWGLEGFATHYLEAHRGCEGSLVARHGVGPLLRLSAVNVSRLELTLAAHGGGDLPKARPFGAIDGELGLSVLFERGRGMGLGPHSALLAESTIFNLYFRQAWLFEQEAIAPQFSLGGGARYLPTFGSPGLCVEGRPYRDARGAQQRASLSCSPGFDAREPRAEIWAKRAAEECASVPAFLQLALELLELSAPLELVTASVRAADEELGHTQAALFLAQRFGGAPVRLAPPPFRQRPPLPRPLALARIAREAWLDGCVNEGHAAARAGAEAEQSRIAEEASVSTRIAHEEAGHARLSADVLRWALAELERVSRAA